MRDVVSPLSAPAGRLAARSAWSLKSGAVAAWPPCSPAIGSQVLLRGLSGPRFDGCCWAIQACLVVQDHQRLNSAPTAAGWPQFTDVWLHAAGAGSNAVPDQYRDDSAARRSRDARAAHRPGGFEPGVRVTVLVLILLTRCWTQVTLTRRCEARSTRRCWHATVATVGIRRVVDLAIGALGPGPTEMGAPTGVGPWAGDLPDDPDTTRCCCATACSQRRRRLPVLDGRLIIADIITRRHRAWRSKTPDTMPISAR